MQHTAESTVQLVSDHSLLEYVIGINTSTVWNDCCHNNNFVFYDDVFMMKWNNFWLFVVKYIYNKQAMLWKDWHNFPLVERVNLKHFVKLHIVTSLVDNGISLATNRRFPYEYYSLL